VGWSHASKRLKAFERSSAPTSSTGRTTTSASGLKPDLDRQARQRTSRTSPGVRSGRSLSARRNAQCRSETGSEDDIRAGRLDARQTSLREDRSSALQNLARVRQAPDIEPVFLARRHAHMERLTALDSVVDDEIVRSLAW